MANNSLTALIEAGADAMDNMYDIILEFGDFNATVRASGFTIPEIKASTYTKKYHGVSYDRVKSSQDFNRNFKLTFRMDAAYGLYDTMTSLQAWHVNPNTGGVSNSNVDKAGTVTVRTIAQPFIAAESGKLTGHLGVDDYSQSSGTVGQIKDDSSNTKQWKFKNCFVTGVGQLKYQTDSEGNEMSFDVDFHFGDVEYPGYEVE